MHKWIKEPDFAQLNWDQALCGNAEQQRNATTQCVSFLPRKAAGTDPAQWQKQPISYLPRIRIELKISFKSLHILMQLLIVGKWWFHVNLHCHFLKIFLMPWNFAYRSEKTHNNGLLNNKWLILNSFWQIKVWVEGRSIRLQFSAVNLDRDAAGTTSNRIWISNYKMRPNRLVQNISEL